MLEANASFLCSLVFIFFSSSQFFCAYRPGDDQSFLRTGIALVSCATLPTISERCDTGASDFRKVSIEASLSYGVMPDYDLRQV